VEKLLCVADKEGMALGANTREFLGEADSSTEFEQMFDEPFIVCLTVRVLMMVR
jgi:hypothetical protein